MQTQARPLIVIAGPTGVGKTASSLELAKCIGGEIVSADSMQVYRGLDIGTAKLPPEERQDIPHHLLDCLDVHEPFHVARFQELAKEAIDAIHERGHIPMLVGGTGFYLQAIARDIDFSGAGEDTERRQKWAEQAEREGPEALHAELQKIDPDAAEAIHPNNVKRVIRALEFHALTGERISEHNAREKERTGPYTLCTFVLTDDRARLYQEIDRRVDSMVEQGLEQEAYGLYQLSLPAECTATKAIGYKEWFPYFAGTYAREEAIRLIKQNTRHYAKRQWTWFRMWPDAHWIDKQEMPGTEQIVSCMMQYLKEAGIVCGSEE